MHVHCSDTLSYNVDVSKGSFDFYKSMHVEKVALAHGARPYQIQIHTHVTQFQGQCAILELLDG